jgi:hypothetical protein
MHTKNLVLTVLVAAIALLFIWYMWMQNAGSVDMNIVTPTTTPVQLPTESAAATSTISLALLDIEQTTNGPVRGCDRVVMVSQSIPSTTAPLTAAMNALFTTSSTTIGGWFNFIPRTNATLEFVSASVSNGTANIYLTGSLSGLAGVCDDPRADIQIEETAKQFPTVQAVQLYLNGQPVDTLAPSMK